MGLVPISPKTSPSDLTIPFPNESWSDFMHISSIDCGTRGTNMKWRGMKAGAGTEELPGVQENGTGNQIKIGSK